MKRCKNCNCELWIDDIKADFRNSKNKLVCVNCYLNEKYPEVKA